ncbi:MAG: hypothetical protein ABUK14_06750, partial [Desulfobacteria bacterium]
AEGHLPNGDYRIPEDLEAALYTRKCKPHPGKLISVIVELPDGYSKIFGDLTGESVRLCPDLNDDSQKACKPVTLHKNAIDSNWFKVKAKNRASVPNASPLEPDRRRKAKGAGHKENPSAFSPLAVGSYRNIWPALQNDIP